MSMQCLYGPAVGLVGGPRTRAVGVTMSRMSRLPTWRRNTVTSSVKRLGVNASGGGEAINPDGIIGPDGEIIKRAAISDPEERKALWKRAIKLPMYSVGLAPVLVSATAAFVHFGAFQPLKTLGLCIAAIAIIAWLNLSNDVFDAATGVDKNKPESVVNLVGNWRKVFLASNVFLLMGVGILFSIVSAVVRHA
jgi:hypothetical protein